MPMKKASSAVAPAASGMPSHGESPSRAPSTPETYAPRP